MEPAAGPPRRPVLVGRARFRHGERFEALVKALDQLDGSESFVHPDAMAQVAATDKSAERTALAAITARLTSSLHELPGREGDHDALRPRGAGVGRRRSG